MTRDLLDDMVQIVRTLEDALGNDGLPLFMAAHMARDRARQAIQRHNFRLTDDDVATAIDTMNNPPPLTDAQRQTIQRHSTQEDTGMTDKLHFDDLTAITCPFGMLDPSTRERLKAWPHEWEFWNIEEWDMARVPSWGSINVYRAKPAPQPVPDVPWPALADWVQYVAMDKDGYGFGYSDKPVTVGEVWDPETGEYAPLEAVKIDWKGLPWDQTLIKRPGVA